MGGMVKMEKKDIHKISRKVDARRKELVDPNIIEFLKDKKIGKWGKKIEKHQEYKYLSQLNSISKHINKPFRFLTESDTEKLYTDLTDDKITRANGKPYTSGSKNTLIKTFKSYMKWLCEEKYRDNSKLDYNRLAKWMKPFQEVVDIPALSKEEILKLASVNNLRNQALILTLFDTGARSTEFLNIRINDIEKIEESDGFYFKIKLRDEFSKTKGRRISCRICKDILDMYLKQRRKDIKSNDDVLFDVGYPAIRKILQRSRVKIGIKKRITPHVIRHSSATYFASILKNPIQLQYRFGWSLADSKMAHRYIDANEIMEEESSKVIKHETISDLKEENDKLKMRLTELENTFKQYMFEQIKKRKEKV